MKEEAIQIFKLISRIEFEIGFISIQDYYLRLVTLFQLTGRSDKIRNYIIENFDNQEFLESEYVDENSSDKLVDNIEEVENYKNNGNEEDFLQFITPKIGKISKWKFTIGDPDFFPSIPHGHSTNNDKIKLDSYRGYYYDTTNTKVKAGFIGRETRQYIIELWNNDNFRIFAIKQIDWYLQRYPKYKWRVSKLRIRNIPKKR
jgi:hypothetical protein